MKKVITLLAFWFLFSLIDLYPQKTRHVMGNRQFAGILSGKSNNIDIAKFVVAGEPKKVLIHYMGWFGEGIKGEHWNCGQTHTPLVGYYNSHSWAIQAYHMLLSWSCGIDGLVLNINDNYDEQSMKLLVKTMYELRSIDEKNFNYEFAISYDDQGMDKIGTDTAIAKFTYFRDNILPNVPAYLKYDNSAAVFIWNYKGDIKSGAPEYLTSAQYESVLDFVFAKSRPLVLWNEIEAPELANSYYPWVQGFADNGSNWGKKYLDWYYKELAQNSMAHKKLKFLTGGVWAGFDQRDNKCWGNSWIDRQKEKVYDSTWNYIHTYPSLYPNSPFSLNWVYIETWNDWNEGTEIEPSKEFGYKYLKATTDHVNQFKGMSISKDTVKYESAKKIYEACLSIQSKRCDSLVYYPLIKRAIKRFFLKDPVGAIAIVDSVINRKQPPAGTFLKNCNWDDLKVWDAYKHNDTAVKFGFTNYSGINQDGLKLDYKLPKSGNWVVISKKSISFKPDKNPITFLIKANISNEKSFLELKYIDDLGRNYYLKPNLSYFKEYWYRVVIYSKNTTYWWGGPENDIAFGNLAKFEIGISADSASEGTVWIDEIGEGIDGLEPSFYYEGSIKDPDSLKQGIGFAQRRSISILKEDPLVYEYLKEMQEISPNMSVVGSYNGDISYHTFDNSIVAMAFIVKNDSLRAQKILDFYASKIDSNNIDIALQNFFYRKSLKDKVQSRGFYQRAYFEGNKAVSNNDRWMGDMVWLALAYRHYIDKFGYRVDYYDMALRIKDLLISYYKPFGTKSGYVQSGWRKGDTYLHEKSGHHEGNIDCYAFFKNCGSKDTLFASPIKNWIEGELSGKIGLPLDLYGWRALAYGKGSEKILNIPEYDFRYRKVLKDSTQGFFTGCSEFRNIWPDGTAHIALAYLNYGDIERGNFYANQLDHLIIAEKINNKLTHSIPYVARNIGGYGAVDISIGSISAAAWYILAKNGFNPMYQKFTVVSSKPIYYQPESITEIFPNPANGFIQVKMPYKNTGTLHIINTQGNILISKQITGSVETIDISYLPKGLYFVKIMAQNNSSYSKIVIK